jgi:hypothetical protein
MKNKEYGKTTISKNGRLPTILKIINFSLQACLICISIGFIATLGYIIAFRIGYPFELEWMEGDMLLTVVRLLAHQNLYTAPSAEYISAIYPPFYYILSAVAFWLFEPSLPVLRSVSVVFLTGIFLQLYCIVSLETHKRWLGVLGMGIFASFYSFHETWYDIGRLDSAFYCLLIGGLWLSSQINNWKLVISGALVLSLTLCTKQSVAVYLPFVTIYLFLKNRRLSVVYALILGVLCCSAFMYLHVTTDGWFTVLTILNPMSLPKNWSSKSELIKDTFGTFPIFIVIAFAGIATLLKKNWGFKKISFWELMFIPSAIAYLRIRPIVGADTNDGIYVTLWLAILIPIWLQRFSELKQTTLYNELISSVCMSMICIQLALFEYSPEKWKPTPGSVDKGEELISVLRNAPGPVFIPNHPMYAWMAGKKPFRHSCNYWVYNAGKRSLYVQNDLIAMIKSGYFSVIVLDDTSPSGDNNLYEHIKNNYLLARNIDYKTPQEFCPLVGFSTRPETIWVYKNNPAKVR